jgi:hypothetical protein
VRGASEKSLNEFRGFSVDGVVISYYTGLETIRAKFCASSVGGMVAIDSVVCGSPSDNAFDNQKTHAKLVGRIPGLVADVSPYGYIVPNSSFKSLGYTRSGDRTTYSCSTYDKEGSDGSVSSFCPIHRGYQLAAQIH